MSSNILKRAILRTIQSDKDEISFDIDEYSYGVKLYFYGSDKYSLIADKLLGLEETKATSVIIVVNIKRIHLEFFYIDVSDKNNEFEHLKNPIVCSETTLKKLISKLEEHVRPFIDAKIKR